MVLYSTCIWTSKYDFPLRWSYDNLSEIKFLKVSFIFSLRRHETPREWEKAHSENLERHRSNARCVCVFKYLSQTYTLKNTLATGVLRLVPGMDGSISRVLTKQVALQGCLDIKPMLRDYRARKNQAISRPNINQFNARFIPQFLFLHTSSLSPLFVCSWHCASQSLSFP